MPILSLLKKCHFPKIQEKMQFLNANIVFVHFCIKYIHKYSLLNLNDISREYLQSNYFIYCNQSRLIYQDVSQYYILNDVGRQALRGS